MCKIIKFYSFTKKYNNNKYFAWIIQSFCSNSLIQKTAGMSDFLNQQKTNKLLEIFKKNKETLKKIGDQEYADKLKILNQQLQTVDQILAMSNIRKKIEFFNHRNQLLYETGKTFQQASTISNNEKELLEQALLVFQMVEGNLGENSIEVSCKLARTQKDNKYLSEIFESLKFNKNSVQLKKVAIHQFINQQSDELYDFIEQLKTSTVEKELMEDYQLAVIKHSVREEYYHSICSHLQECKQLGMSYQKRYSLIPIFCQIQNEQASFLISKMYWNTILCSQV